MDSVNVSTSWTSPPLSSLNVYNCDVATPWAAAFMKLGNDTARTLDIPTKLTVAYLRSMIPQNWTSQPSDTDVIIWSFKLFGANNSQADPEYTEWYKRVVEFPLYDCERICSELEWQGDPDVSGIGMMISYYVALALATIYFIALAATRVGLIRPSRDHPHRKSNTVRIIESFQESINTFLDASLIFAASMLGAALVRYASVIRDPMEMHTAYEMIGSVFMSAFSIFPALMLQAVTDGPRTHFIRHFLWFAVISFTIGVEVLYRHSYGPMKRLNENSPTTQQTSIETIRWNLCEDKEIREGIEYILTAGHFILALNLIWWFYYLVLAAIPSRWKTAWNSRSRRWVIKWDWRTTFRIANGILCFAVACCFIILFHRYRNSIHELTKGSDKDSDWQFGQVLALATWVPVAVDFLAILIYGPERGMSGKISSHYRVVRNDEVERKGEPFQIEGTQDYSDSTLNIRD